jgi:hypothetical protein
MLIYIAGYIYLYDKRGINTDQLFSLFASNLILCREEALKSIDLLDKNRPAEDRPVPSVSGIRHPARGFMASRIGQIGLIFVEGG